MSSRQSSEEEMQANMNKEDSVAELGLHPDLKGQRTERKSNLERRMSKGWEVRISMVCLGVFKRQ